MQVDLSFKTLVEAQRWTTSWLVFFTTHLLLLAFLFLLLEHLLKQTELHLIFQKLNQNLFLVTIQNITGMRFAFFALAEYIEVFVVCGVAAAAFLGGYKVPFDLEMVHSLLKNSANFAKNIGQFLQLGSFVTKTLLLYYVVIWIRWTLPRMRVDHLNGYLLEIFNSNCII